MRITLLLAAPLSLWAQAATLGIPFHLEQNGGQFAPEWHFAARTSSGMALVRPQALLLGNGTRLDFLRAAPNATWTAEWTTARANYYQRHRAPVSSRLARAIRYHSVWPGVDIAYHGAGGSLEFDLLLSPAARLQDVTLSLSAAPQLTPDGRLIVPGATGETVLRAPVAWAETEAGRRKVKVAYQVTGTTVTLVATGRLSGEALTVDPVVTWASYWGGPGVDGIDLLDIDPLGNRFIAGPTGGGFRTLSPPGAFIGRIDPNGELQYLTYIGGTRAVRPFSAIATDGEGHLFAVGENPIASAFRTTVTSERASLSGFVLKLNAKGELLHAAFAPRDLYPRALALDHDGRVILAGTCTAPEDPSTAKACAARLELPNVEDSARVLADSPSDSVHAVALDHEGNIIVAGTGIASQGRTAGAFQTLNTGSSLFRSDDGGTSWRPSEAGLGADAVASVQWDALNANRAWAFTARRILRSDDLGRTWRATGEMPANWTAVTVSPNQNNRIYAAAAGSLRRSDDGGATWSEMASTSFGVRQVVVQRGVERVFHVPAVGGLLRWDEALRTWSPITMPFDPRGVPLPRMLTTSLARPYRLYADSGSSGAIVSEDGLVWTFRPSVNLSCVSMYAHPADPNRVFCLNQFSQLAVSADGATTWNTLPLPGFANSFGADAGQPGHWFVTTSQSAFRTTDGGANFEPMTNGLAGAAPQGVFPHPQFSGVALLVARYPSDIFVTKFKADFSGTIFSTLVGSSSHEEFGAMRLDAQGRILVAGTISSGDFPGPAGALSAGPRAPDTQAAFLFRLSADGSTMEAQNTFGGAAGASAVAIAQSPSGDLAILGNSRSPELFPAGEDAIGKRTGEGSSPFLCVLRANGELRYFSWLGDSSGSSQASTVQFDPDGRLHIVLSTFSSGLSTTADALSQGHGGQIDAHWMIVDLDR